MTAASIDRPRGKARAQRLARPDVPEKTRYSPGLIIAARFLCWATRNNRQP